VYNASYNEAVKVFDELDAFGSKMEEIVAAIKANEVGFNIHLTLSCNIERYLTLT